MYKNCASVLEKVVSGQKTLKNALYEEQCQNKNEKKIYAISSQTLKYHAILKEIIENSTLSKEFKKSNLYNQCLAILHSYELLFGQLKNDHNLTKLNKNSQKQSKHFLCHFFLLSMFQNTILTHISHIFLVCFE